MLELPRVERVPCYWRRMNRFEPKANLRAPPVCIKKELWRGQAEPSPLWQLNHHCQNTNRTQRTSRLVVNKLLSRHGWPFAWREVALEVSWFFIRRWAHVNNANTVGIELWLHPTCVVREIRTSTGGGLTWCATWLQWVEKRDSSNWIIKCLMLH